MPGPLDLTDLLKRALQVEARQVRLSPGRRTIVSLPQGDSEVRGDVWSAETIEQIVASVITPAARGMLRTGLAEWDFPLEGRGSVRARVELKSGAQHVTFGLERALPGGALAEARVPAPAPVSGGIPLAEEPRAPLASPAVSVPSPRASFEEPSGPTAAIDRLLYVMLEKKASDLHVSTTSPPLLRLDGEMVPIAGEGELNSESMQRMLMPIVPERNREEFERTHDADFAYELPGRARFRVNIFVDLRGMGAVFRVIPTKILTVDDLGLPKDLLTLCHLPKGLVLVTGPTGSGKSTTLAALIDYINRNRSA
ncbi:MAG TPA: ATPase, T2SS/T4P/T4SS family, partial [Polyangiaceae bacterium]|nr:ATPase, T2SS/T4P/T4SS family [Polyangiaceae bacterium]